MLIWLITVGEPLPSDSTNERLLRTGILANALKSRGHEIVWWTSSFDHIRKRHRIAQDKVIIQADNYRIIMLHSLGYKRNISLSRFVDHCLLARKFKQAASKEPVPDIILCSMPTIELSREAVRYGKARNIPVIIDIRDLWPDIFVDHAPAWIRQLVRIFLTPKFLELRKLCANASAIIGITDPIVDWGIKYAGRSRKQIDRAFPFGYIEKIPIKEDITQANHFWHSHNISPEEFIICFFGTIGHQFDLMTVIDAAKILATGPRRFRFILCGSGDSLAAYKKITLQLDNIIFPGWIGAAEIWTLMRKAHVGLAPYHNSKDFQSSLPNKTIEYLSAGLPIVSSLHGELEKLLLHNKCGVTYLEKNPNSLVTCLNGLYDNHQDLKNFSAAAKRLYLKKFTASKIYGELSDYLEFMAKQHVSIMGDA